MTLRSRTSRLKLTYRVKRFRVFPSVSLPELRRPPLRCSPSLPDRFRKLIPPPASVFVCASLPSPPSPRCVASSSSALACLRLRFCVCVFGLAFLLSRFSPVPVLSRSVSLACLRLRFRAWGLGFAFSPSCLGFGVSRLGFGVWPFAFGVWGLGFRVCVLPLGFAFSLLCLLGRLARPCRWLLRFPPARAGAAARVAPSVPS